MTSERTELVRDIAAIVGLKDSFTGDTLSDPDHPVILEAIVFPEPVLSYAIEPRSRGDEEKISGALQRLQVQAGWRPREPEPPSTTEPSGEPP